MTYSILSRPFMSVFLELHQISRDAESIRKVGDVTGFAQSHPKSPGQRRQRERGDKRNHWLKAEQPRLDSKEALSSGPMGIRPWNKHATQLLE